MTLPLLARTATGPQLRPYQVEAIDAIRERFAAGDRSTLLVLATGLGKTICFAEVARRVVVAGGQVLVLAHRTELLDQARGKLEALGLDVALEQAQTHASRVSGVVVASVQTLRKKRLEEWKPDHFRLVVIDEAHHAAAKTYRTILDHFSGAKILGVTATPDRGDGKGLAELFDSVAYRFEIGASIREGWLSPISARRILVEGLDLSAIRTTAGDLNQGELDLAMREPAAVDGVAEPLVKLAASRPTLVFTVTVEHARALAVAVNDRAPGTAEALDGSADRDHRAEVLRRYQSGELRMLVNCALFTEGFDAPSTSCIAIARPTKSRALYTQMVGRGTRLAPGKSECLILDFAGLAGRHKLTGPADVLTGEPLDDDEQAELEKLLGQGEADVFELLDRAKENAKRARERKAIPWTSVDVDLFGDSLGEGYNREHVGMPLTDAQAELLERKGVDIKQLDRARAAVLVAELKRRHRENLCTYKQAKVLRRAGVNAAHLSLEQASKFITELSARRWRPSASWLERAHKAAKAAEAELRRPTE